MDILFDVLKLTKKKVDMVSFVCASHCSSLASSWEGECESERCNLKCSDLTSLFLLKISNCYTLNL